MTDRNTEASPLLLGPLSLIGAHVLTAIRPPMPSGKTGSALTSVSSPVGGDDRVLRRELVAVLAVGLPGMMGGDTFTPQNILPRRYGLKVLGIQAPPVTAQVVEFHPIGNRTHENDVGGAMGANIPRFGLSGQARGDDRVAIGERARPFPAPVSGLLSKLRKTLLKIHPLERHMRTIQLQSWGVPCLG